ncbi:MAG: hypothetical protein HQL30_10605 [Candidatus Omnitrophica bacterium]|nr:hypothetical protein [Candidatus Omnitrophota bacterium]
MAKLKFILITPFLLLSYFTALGEENEEAKQETRLSAPGDLSRELSVKSIRVIKLPKGYHEGLFINGEEIWVANGQKLPIWVIDKTTGEVIRTIEPTATFTEGITRDDKGEIWTTDWDTQNLYRVNIINDRFVPAESVSFGPSHVAGTVFAAGNIYVLTWTRGLGTKYHLNKFDMSGELKEKLRIENIPEPSQLAWDGKYLWMSSWFNRRVYFIDPATNEVKGYISTKLDRTTGIAWDGKYLWATGTSEDLVQFEIEPVGE